VDPLSTNPEHSSASDDNVVPDEDMARDLRGFGPRGLAAFLAILITLLVGGNPCVPLAAILVLIWAWLSRTPWREIGFARPKSWIASLVIGTVLGIAFKFLMKAIVMPLLGADPVNQAFHYLAGNRAALPSAIWMMIVVAGFGEETVFRGYLFERLGKLLGSAPWTQAFIVLLTAAAFGLAHYSNQGLAGVEQATMVGLVFGAIFSRTRRLWMLMTAHAAFDLTALVMIYLNLESTVAHLFFN
jgi:membrane protease YdiL (CAAX protease family)